MHAILRVKAEMIKRSSKLTVGAGDEAAKSKSSGDDLHNDCEWIDTENVMMMLVRVAFYTC